MEPADSVPGGGAQSQEGSQDIVDRDSEGSRPPPTSAASSTADPTTADDVASPPRDRDRRRIPSTPSTPPPGQSCLDLASTPTSASASTSHDSSASVGGTPARSQHNEQLIRNLSAFFPYKSDALVVAGPGSHGSPITVATHASLGAGSVNRYYVDKFMRELQQHGDLTRIVEYSNPAELSDIAKGARDIAAACASGCFIIQTLAVVQGGVMHLAPSKRPTAYAQAPEQWHRTVDENEAEIQSFGPSSFGALRLCAEGAPLGY